jgi:putative nucleotidyltransferase with HDIG domain
MKKEKKTRDLLIEELQEMHEKITELEKVKVRYNQLEKELKHSYKKLQQIMEGIAYVITKVVEIRDPYSTGHQQRVSKLATAIAREMKLPQDKIEGVRFASLVHDIGKISLPAEILNKPTKLSEIEYSLIKDHSQTGYDILKSIEFPWPIAKIVLQHHERLNGSGYPQRLKGEDIILEARIIGVVDVVEAMSSHRPYRPALGIDAALEEITQNKGILYDPEVVDVCLKLFKKKEFKF